MIRTVQGRVDAVTGRVDHGGMADGVYFTSKHHRAVDESMIRAEELIGDRYRLASFGPSRYLYEVATLERQTEEERAPGAFAHQTRYARTGSGPDARRTPPHFYRICLQDDGILNTVKRPDIRFDLDSLLLYIMAHELIHIVRFEQFQMSFAADEVARSSEEKVVHGLTYEVLQSCREPPMLALLEHYRHHRIPRCF